MNPEKRTIRKLRISARIFRFFWARRRPSNRLRTRPEAEREARRHRRVSVPGPAQKYTGRPVHLSGERDRRTGPQVRFFPRADCCFAIKTNKDTSASLVVGSWFETFHVLRSTLDPRRFPSDPLHLGYILKGLAIGVMPVPLAHRGSRSSRTHFRKRLPILLEPASPEWTGTICGEDLVATNSVHHRKTAPCGTVFLIQDYGRGGRLRRGPRRK